jgi:hypothetical protein
METEILEIEFRAPRKHKIYVTNFMKEVLNRTYAVHAGDAIVIYAGEAGVGKTSTARKICESLERKFDSGNPNAFRGIHFQFGRISRGQGNEAKRAIRSVYDAVGLNLPEGEYNTMSVQRLCSTLIEYLRLNRIQMIFADEAGLLSLEAVGGLITLLDIADDLQWLLTIILVGMDDLALKLKSRQQTFRRSCEWIYFTRYDLEDTIKLLRAMHPYFAGLDENIREGKAQFEFMYEITLGLPGFMFPFINRFDYRWRGLKNLQPITLEFLQTVHMITLDDMDRAVELSRHGYIKEKTTGKEAVGEDNDE